MGRYIKYEIKGSYKFILGVLALVLILTTVLYTYIAKKESSPVIALASMIIFGTALTTFLYIVGSFRKELYEDRGYLTFTLPLTGHEILGAKLITATIWFLLLGIVIIGYNTIMLANMAPIKPSLKEIIAQVFPHITKGTVMSFLLVLLGGISTLILIYLSMALGRVTFRNKKIGGLWFVIFLVLSMIVGIGQAKIVISMPYYVNLDTFKIVSYESIMKGMNYTSVSIFEINDAALLTGMGDQYILNIAGFIYMIGIMIINFLLTGYIIENKIDL
ncbi:MAG: hypothetical protein GX981_02010 [Tissierellia bacterium]|nr:hypothetical protein [Tissierellia bacterium]